MSGFTVSELARRVEATPDTVRYYERIGLLPQAERSPGGYRMFGDDDVERMEFIRRAQRFGLQLDDIRQLLEVRERGLCPCGHANELLTRKAERLEEDIAALRVLRDDIRQMLNHGSVADGGCWSCEPGLVQIEPRTGR